MSQDVFLLWYNKNVRLKNRVYILKGRQANYISQCYPLQVRAFIVLLFGAK